MSGIPLPVKVLSLAAALTFVLFAGLGWYVWELSRSLDLVRTRDFRLMELMGTARATADGMVLAARMGAVTGDTLWQRQYEEYRTRWLKLVAELSRQAPDLYGPAADADFVQSIRRSFPVEDQAFRLAEEKRHEAAVALLTGSEYESQKAAYSEGTRRVAEVLRRRLLASLEEQRWRGMMAVAGFALTLPPLLCSWVASVRLTSRHFAARRRAEDALRESEERFRTMADTAPVLIWMSGADSLYSYFNKGWLDFTGNRLEEELGKGWLRGVHAEDLERSIQTYREAFLRREPFQREYRLRRADGDYRWILEAGVPRREPNGRFAGYVGCSVDITGRRRAEQALRESEQRLRTLFEGIDDAVFVHDLEGRILDCNAAACRRLGYSREELLSLCTHDIEAPEFGAGFARRVGKQLADRKLNCEGVHVTRDGRRILVDINTSVIDYQGHPAVLAVIRDITERKRVEEELERMRRSAEAASRAKSEFLANMSHEIRTPMNGILGMTQLTLDTELTTEQREFLQMVNSSAHSLLSLINEILDFSKIEAGKLDLERIEFSLRDNLVDTIKVMAHKAREKGLELVCRIAPEAPERVIGDPGRLRQIVVNLIGNAIKFTDRGAITVDVRRRAEPIGETAELEFTVSDTGIGIPSGKLKDIFQPFTQADGSTTRRYGGTGLGLAICAQLVKLMGGEIWAESEIGEGSRFHFTARLGLTGKEAQPTGELPEEALPSLAGLRVLAVDDTFTTRRLLEEMLHNWKMAPVMVGGAGPALREMQRAVADGQAFPLVLIDADMPETDGMALLEAIEERYRDQRPSVILLTGLGRRLDAVRWRDLGVRGWVRKPVKQSELLDAIALAVQGRSLERLRESTEQAAPQPAPALVQPLKVLLAEDNVVNQKLAVRLLEKRGHSVVVAGNGREAVEAIGREPFDVVLMDVQMPEMGGFEATALIRLREWEQARRTGAPWHVPIIAMTANAMKGDREKCLEAGMDGYVAKPVRPSELYEAVENVSTRGAASEPRLLPGLEAADQKTDNEVRV